MNPPALICPDLGRWRVWLEEPRDDQAAILQAHLATCAHCAELVSELRQNAALAAALIRPLVPESAPSAATIELARTRLNAARAGVHPIKERRRMTLAMPFGRWRAAVAGLAAALMLMAFLGTPFGRDATAQFLGQFRAERLEPVPLSTTQIQDLERAFEELDRLGTVAGIDDSTAGPQEVASIAEAERIAGFAVKRPDPATLPDGVAEPTRIGVLSAGTVRFTFDQAKANAYYRSIGRQNVTLPDRFDGVTVVVNTPPAVLLQYGGSDAPNAGLAGLGIMVGQAGAVTADVQGDVSLEEMREFLLSLPGLSPGTVRQVRSIQDWQNTLPLPIPTDQVNWERTTVAGGPGFALGEKTGLGSVFIWQRDGMIYGVGGLGGQEGIRDIADSLR